MDVLSPVAHRAMGYRKKRKKKKKKKKKKPSASVAMPPAPVRVPSQRPLAPSVASVMSVTNDKGDNEMILRLCTDLLVFALQPRKTPENLS